MNERTSPGVIRADESYTMLEFCNRAGLGNTAFRQVRRNGLKIIEIGRKRYVRGADWLAYLERVAAKGHAEMAI